MDANFFELKGQTITRIDLGKETKIWTTTGVYLLEHHQDCCESVDYVGANGNIDDILNRPITLAEEDTSEEPPTWHQDKREYKDSWTFSTYTLKTDAGYFQFLFLGESNGYYGETLSFSKVCAASTS